jgi:hypothetical protein
MSRSLFTLGPFPRFSQFDVDIGIVQQMPITQRAQSRRQHSLTRTDRSWCNGNFSPIEKLAYRVSNGGSWEKEERLLRSGKLRRPKYNCRGQVKPCRRAAKECKLTRTPFC